MNFEEMRKRVLTRAINLPGGWMPAALYRMTMMAIERETRTEQQMRLLPMRAVFICSSSDHDAVEHARQLAKRVGREDIEIWPPSMLDDQKNALRSFTGVVIDESVMLTSKQIYTLAAAKSRIGRK